MAGDLEAIREEAERQKVPKEESAVTIGRALKKRCEDQNLAVGRCRELKKRTQDDGGSRQTDDAQAGAMLQEEPRKDGRSERDVERNRNATTAYETEA
jgi:hypothetical protein